MKLFYTPGVCSLSPHIVLNEAGYSFDLVRVDLKQKRTEAGQSLQEVHAKNYVPLLELDDGEVLSEGTAIVQFLADGRPDSQLLAPVGTRARYRAVEWLGYIGTELHKPFWPLFHRDIAGEEWPRHAVQKITTHLTWVESQLTGDSHVLGSDFSVVDAYLFTVLTWTRAVAIDLQQWPHLTRYMARVAQRPAVQKSLRREGLDESVWLRAAA